MAWLVQTESVESRVGVMVLESLLPGGLAE